MRTNLKTPAPEYREMMQCNCKTCVFQVLPYAPSSTAISGTHSNRKAGAFLFDKEEDRILLVQSRGNLWGCPKGSLHLDEDFQSGAIREVQEETGIELSVSELTHPIWVSHQSAVYYYIETSYTRGGEVQEIDGNDANGLVWIKLDCLARLMSSDNMKITSHTRKAIQNTLQKELPRKIG